MTDAQRWSVSSRTTHRKHWGIQDTGREFLLIPIYQYLYATDNDTMTIETIVSDPAAHIMQCLCQF
jgi:hypothetical protein